LIDGVNYICADSRILIMIPNNMNYQEFFKKELETNEYKYDESASTDTDVVTI